MSAPIQQRIDGVAGYGLPLRPEALAELSEFELAHILYCLELDDEQIVAAEEAVRRVVAGTYLNRGPA